MTESLAGGAAAAPLSMHATAVVASSVIRAARQLLTDLERSRRIDAAVLRGAMEAAFGASDATGAWNWKTAYDACEAATVLFLRRYGAAMRAKATSSAAMLPMLMRITSLLPTQTRRSEEGESLQQFSTPIGLAFVASRAAAITPTDVVLEPSAGTGLLAILADASWELPSQIRGIFLVAWIGLGAFMAWATLMVPLFRRLDPAALAAVVEEKYPDLGERLTSTVELADGGDAYHGSRVLIDLLVAETEARASRLDFLRPFSARQSRRLAVATGVVLFGVLSLAASSPGRHGELVARFLFPWRDSGLAAVPYAFEVTPGDGFAAKGRPLAIAVSIRPVRENVDLPRSSSLVITDADGKTSRHRMIADRADAFSFKIERVGGDFSYRVEAGDAVSETYRVAVVEPVELAADSPAITITPPEYAQATFQTQMLHGLGDLSALQHSRVRFEFRFTQPAVKASIAWISHQSQKDADKPAVSHALKLSPDGLAAEFELPAKSDGSYQLLLEAEHGILTELNPRALTVKIDQPPAFSRVFLGIKPASGKSSSPDDLRVVPAYETVPLEFIVLDDVGVDRAELEYRINDGPAQSEAIELDGRGTLQATGRHPFKLAGKVKEADTVQYRLKAADNRRVPEAKLEPHIVYYPAERWLTLKIARQAEPLQQQEMVAQRDDMSRRLEKIKSDLLREQRNLYKLRMEAKDQQALKPEQTENLKELRQENRSVETALRELARDTADNSALRPISDRAQEIADQEMQRSEQGLQQAEKGVKSDPRDNQLQKADRELASAVKRLEELQKANEQLAQARLDQLKLEQTAQRQQQLANRATEQAAKDPIKDPASKAENEKLKGDQQDIAKDLRQLTEQSDPLRNALDAARAEQTKQMAERAQELAKDQRELAQASRETEQRQRADELAKLAKKQRELAEQADRLAKKTKPATEATKTNPLKPDDARKAAEALEKADTQQALQRQDKSAQELDRVASDLDRAIEKAKQDAAKPESLSRQAVQQMAKQQRELAQSTEKAQKEAAKQPGEQGKQSLQKSLEQLGRQQRDLNERAAKLPTEQTKPAAEQARTQMTKAEQALANKDADRAKRKQNEAADALDRLAKQLPEKSQNQKTSPEAKPNRQQTAEARQLARQQRELRDAVQRLASQQQPPRGSQENPVAELAKEQQAIAQKASELAKNVGQEQGKQSPTPTGQQAKQAAQSAQQTSNQMQAGNLPRAQESGRQTAEQLQKLAKQLQEKPQVKPKPPASEPSKEASQLARRQEEVNRRMQQLAGNADAQRAQQESRQQELQRQTGELARDLNQMAQQASRSPPAQQSAQQAANSSRQAESSMQQAQQQSRQGNPSQSQQAQQQAAQALDRAAQQAAQAAQQMMARQGSPQQTPAAQTGQALQQAQSQMNQAQNQLAQNRPQSAQSAMQQAAQALQQASQQMANQPPTGKPPPISSGNFGSGEGEPADERVLPKDLKKYAGKRWGELPGELRTKIIQDMKAQYGDDYARIIKLYFEQIADTKAKNKK